ncbi:MAG: bifunctional oligoribonuclease/PAP phosphatase NrnA [Synergistes sp.]|nr:bifunctional oligoribonuclease/PAP phosphatase NrnA [Synergistes sp.]
MSDLLGLYEEAAKKLKNYGKWVVICHENPDGDTLGCAFALASLAKRCGKSALLVCKDQLPVKYSFLAASDDLTVTKALPAEDVRGALLIAVDISTPARALDNIDELLSDCADSLNIDHHGDNKNYAATNIVVPGASASAEVVTRLFEVYGEGITKDEATALYTALVTDNGNFRFNSTTVESHRCAQVLINAGAEPSVIDDRIHENMTDKDLRLWGLALSRTTLFAGGKCALFWLRSEEISSAGADSSSLDGLINMLMRVIGVKIALFLSEQDSGENKLSVRCRPPYNARTLAAKFGGGGHTGAAGAKPKGTFDEALAAVMKEAEEYADLGNSAGK